MAVGFNVLDNAGVGFIVIVAVCVDPEHPSAVGVTVIVPLIAEFVPFVAVKVGTDVVPDAANPILVLLFDHAYVVDATPFVLEKVMADDVTPAQSVCALTASTVGVGLTETTTLFVALQPFDVIVYTYVTSIAAFVVFVKVSLMFPDPNVNASVIPVIVALDQLIVVLPLDATVALVAV